MKRLFALLLGLCMAAPQISYASSVAYWSLFNIEGESSDPSVYVTYASLSDMLNDTNRIGQFVPGSFSRNVVGSGSDGATYWSLFNVEGESSDPSVYVTYASLSDMLNDTNRVGQFVPGSASRNVVGSGAYFIPDTPGSVPVPASFWLMFGMPAVFLNWRARNRFSPRRKTI